MNSDEDRRPHPTAPGYGDQGPAGAGREGEQDEVAATDEKQEPAEDRSDRE